MQFSFVIKRSELNRYGAVLNKRIMWLQNTTKNNSEFRTLFTIFFFDCFQFSISFARDAFINIRRNLVPIIVYATSGKNFRNCMSNV